MRKIIIVGAGEVGSFLAQKLSAEQHEVTVIEEDSKKVENISNHFKPICLNTQLPQAVATAKKDV